MNSSLLAYPPGYLTENKSHRYITVVTVLFVLEVIFTGLFFASKLRSKLAIGLETWLMIPSFLCCIGSIIIGYLSVTYGGFGRHIAAITVKERNLYPKIAAAYQFVYPGGFIFPKLTILCLYLRFFGITRKFRWAAYTIATVLVVHMITCLIVGAAGCRPFAFRWDKSIPGGKCWNISMIYTWFSIPNLVTDVAMLALPLPAIWTLKMSRGQKVGLTLTFLTGSIGLITAAIRLVRFAQLDGPGEETDFTWTHMGLGIWSTAESGTYLVAACLPSLRSFLKPVKNAFGIRSMSTRYSHSAYTLNDTSDPFAEHLPREPQTAFHSPSGSLDRGELDCTEVQRAECRWYSEGSSQNPGVQSEDEGNEVRVQRSRSFPSETDIRISE